jgi:hypothetical protein
MGLSIVKRFRVAIVRQIPLIAVRCGHKPDDLTQIKATNPSAKDIAGIPDMSAPALAWRFEQPIATSTGFRSSHIRCVEN